MGMNKQDVENIKNMNERLAKKKKPGFWSGVRKGMQQRGQENRERRKAEDKIRSEAFQKARRSEIKRQAAAKGRASARGWTYTARGNYNPIGAMFDRGITPTKGYTKKRSSKKRKKRKTKKARSNSYGAFDFDAVDNWGLM